MSEPAIHALLASFTPLPALRPWPRHEVDFSTWTAIGEILGAGGGDLLGLWAEEGSVHLALRAPDLPLPVVVSVRVRDGAFPSIGRHHVPAIRLERAIFDLYGHVPSGTPDARRWLDHGAWGFRAPLGARNPAEPSDPAAYDFLPVSGEGLHQIPVGPVHAGIIEPGHFRFTANGEIVARLEARLGYVHKGIEALIAGADLDKAARLVARVSGDETVALSFAFARAVEAALDIAVPERAQVLRGVMAELERVANHLGDIGAICNDATFTLIHAHCGIFRERVLAVCDRAFGHRLMMDAIVPGGVAQDIGPPEVRALVAALEEIAPRFAEIVRLYDDTPSLQDRTCATGRVAPDLVARFAAGGHVGRASGRDFDTRRDLAYPPYVGAAFNVPVLTAGDVDARVWIRIREVEASLQMLRTWLLTLPDGPVRVAVPSFDEAQAAVAAQAAIAAHAALAVQPAVAAHAAVAAHEGIAMTEAFRGDVLVWLRIGPDGRVARCHVRDPSWFQWPLLEAAIEGNIVADFPLCNKSFNCSYSGHDL